MRATEDVDLLVPDDPVNDRALDIALTGLDARWVQPDRPFAPGELAGREHSRLWTRGGLVDLLREGAAPLEFTTVREDAHVADLGAGPFHVAGLASVVAFKRLADRPRDRADLDELREIHGELPTQRLPGVDGERGDAGPDVS